MHRWQAVKTYIFLHTHTPISKFDNFDDISEKLVEIYKKTKENVCVAREREWESKASIPIYDSSDFGSKFFNLQ
jgi:ribosomal protein S24E